MSRPVKEMKLNIKLTHHNAVIPRKAHTIDNGYDLIAVDYEYDKSLDCYVYNTGVAIQVPEGYSLDVIPKSRHRKTGVYMPNTPGDIDPGYTGNIYVSYKPRLPRVVYDILSTLCKVFKLYHFQQELDNEINPPYGVGQEIAQCYLTPHPEIEFIKVDKLNDTERGNKGHGSTGELINFI